jgi:hypothetical protein
MIEMEKEKGINYRMNAADHKELKMICVQKGVSMQEFIDRAVQEYRKKWVV